MGDLISRESLLKALEQSLNEDRYISLRDLITSAPAIEQGEAVGWCWYNKHTFAFTLGNYKPEYDTFPDNAIDIQPVYTQPQSVSDELEAKLAIAIEALESIASNPSQSLMLTVYPNMDSRAHKALEALDKIRKAGE
jgi:hypothetical protein